MRDTSAATENNAPESSAAPVAPETGPETGPEQQAETGGRAEVQELPSAPEHDEALAEAEDEDEAAALGAAEPLASDDEGGPRPPTVIVDSLHVVYRVIGGKRANARRARLARGQGVGGRVTKVHALKGVSFTAYEGDSIGIVGSNGSGKSTLLRVIAGLLRPTNGQVYADGEPTLLGVNAALMNELSGERNIVLGGLALGMTRKQVSERFDEIVGFSGLGDFVHLPMSTYSSGMGARLRFAVASSVAPRVLLIDEALATGDAQFRKRSEQRIRELRENAATVFLVSHSLTAIRKTCNRALWIDKGVLKADGPVNTVLSAYRRSVKG